MLCLCSECDGCCVFCLYCEAWSCRCSCMGSVSVSSCRCCMFVSSNGVPIYRFLGMPAMRTRWMAGAAAHKRG